MKPFSAGIPRWMVLSLALVAFMVIPPDTLAMGPDICVWKHLFGLSACPACGSTRALAAFFHGHLSQALAYNHNVIVTGPVLIGLLAYDIFSGIRRGWARQIAAKMYPRFFTS